MGFDCRTSILQVREVVKPAIPYAVQSAASLSAFTLGLALTQAAGLACRVSCATPVLGPALGMVGVGAASAMAGQASLLCRQEIERRSSGGATLRPPPPPLLRRKDLALDALLGVVLFKALGGRFRSLLPSDLFWPGAMAVESLPAPSAQYAASEHRGELYRLFRRDGCHHCGQRMGKVVGDHIPPNKLVHGSKAVSSLMRKVERTLGVVPAVGRHSAAAPRGPLERLQQAMERQLGVHARGRLAGVVQRFYPQCRACSDRQAAAVRLDHRTLVAHFSGFRPPYAAAALVGLRHYQASTGYQWGFAEDRRGHSKR